MTEHARNCVYPIIISAPSRQVICIISIAAVLMGEYKHWYLGGLVHLKKLVNSYKEHYRVANFIQTDLGHLLTDHVLGNYIPHTLAPAISIIKPWFKLHKLSGTKMALSFDVVAWCGGGLKLDALWNCATNKTFTDSLRWTHRLGLVNR